MEEKKHLFIPTQLMAVLDPFLLKVLTIILCFQKNGLVYDLDFIARTYNIYTEEFDKSVQSLYDNGLVNVHYNGTNFIITPIEDAILEYGEIPFKEIQYTERINLADKVTWNDAKNHQFGNLSRESIVSLIDYLKGKLDEVDKKNECETGNIFTIIKPSNKDVDIRFKRLEEEIKGQSLSREEAGHSIQKAINDVDKMEVSDKKKKDFKDKAVKLMEYALPF